MSISNNRDDEVILEAVMCYIAEHFPDSDGEDRNDYRIVTTATLGNNGNPAPYRDQPLLNGAMGRATSATKFASGTGNGMCYLQLQCTYVAGRTACYERTREAPGHVAIASLLASIQRAPPLRCIG